MALSPITPLQPISRPDSTSGDTTTEAVSGAFEAVLSRVLGGAATADAQATQAVQGLATGEADDVHTAALAIAQADISFRLALSVRNRLLDAYQEVIRLQV